MLKNLGFYNIGFTKVINYEYIDYHNNSKGYSQYMANKKINISSKKVYLLQK